MRFNRFHCQSPELPNDDQCSYITVTMKMPVMFNEGNTVIVHTNDHPENYLGVNLTRAFSVLSILLIALVIESGWLLLRR